MNVHQLHHWLRMIHRLQLRFKLSPLLPKVHTARATTDTVVMGGVVEAKSIVIYMEIFGCLQDLKVNALPSSMNALITNLAVAVV